MELLDVPRTLIALGLFAALGYVGYVIAGLLRAPPHSDDAGNITALREELARLSKRVERLEVGQEPAPVDEGRVAEPGDPLYVSAAGLLQDGFGSDEVASRLGLSRAEVDLISVLARERGAKAGSGN